MGSFIAIAHSIDPGFALHIEYKKNKGDASSTFSRTDKRITRIEYEHLFLHGSLIPDPKADACRRNLALCNTAAASTHGRDFSFSAEDPPRLGSGSAAGRNQSRPPVSRTPAPPRDARGRKQHPFTTRPRPSRRPRRPWHGPTGRRTTTGSTNYCHAHHVTTSSSACRHFTVLRNNAANVRGSLVREKNRIMPFRAATTRGPRATAA